MVLVTSVQGDLRTLPLLYRNIQSSSNISEFQDPACLATAWNKLTMWADGAVESGHGQECEGPREEAGQRPSACMGFKGLRKPRRARHDCERSWARGGLG